MVEVGANYFSDVPFPLRVGERYVHVAGGVDDEAEPSVKVFRWDATTGLAFEEQPESTAPLTWGFDKDQGALRLVVARSSSSAIEGYAAGSPADAVTVVIHSDQIQIIDGDEIIGVVGGNDLARSPIGVSVDPIAGGFSIGGRLPDGFAIGVRHQDDELVLSSLVTPKLGPCILQGHRFESCTIHGPAILMPGGELEISGCDFNMQGAHVESLVWPLPPAGQPYGGIIVQKTAFVGCHLNQVAFAVPQDQRSSFLRMITGR